VDTIPTYGLYTGLQMTNRRDRLRQAFEGARTIQPEQARTYLAMMAYLRRMAEELAPELFKWVGWSVATAAIRVVTIKTYVPWLGVLPWVLLIAISLRINWFLGPVELKEESKPDGSVTLEHPTWAKLLVAILTGLITWALAYVIVFELANAIAAFDLTTLSTPQK
jgi:hypothetical protein